MSRRTEFFKERKRSERRRWFWGESKAEADLWEEPERIRPLTANHTRNVLFYQEPR